MKKKIDKITKVMGMLHKVRLLTSFPILSKIPMKLAVIMLKTMAIMEAIFRLRFPKGRRPAFSSGWKKFTEKFTPPIVLVKNTILRSTKRLILRNQNDKPKTE